MIVVGIDEAGRGPVVGSMFVALVAMDDEDLERLKLLGLKDSKKLTPTRRRMLYNIILRKAKFVIVKEIKPEDIDKRNVNEITIEAMKELLLRAKERLEIGKVYADAVGRRATKLINALKEVVDVEVVVEPKADSKYLAVAAASVVAKEMRERHVAELKKRYGDFGSGYPSDPRTREWLKSRKELPPVVRKKWKTTTRLSSREGVRGREHDNSAQGEGGRQ